MTVANNDLKMYFEFTPQGKILAEKICEKINDKLGFDCARVGYTYFDYGQGLVWETILYHSVSIDMECQLLSPRQAYEINVGYMREEKIQKIVELAN